MTTEESTRPPEVAPGPGQIEVEASTLCGAPDCGLTLVQHQDANGLQEKGYHINGVPVGSWRCATVLAAMVPGCAVCGRHGEHTCTRAARAYLTRLKTQIVLPAPSSKAVA